MTYIKFMLFLATIWSYSFAVAQDGRIIEQVKINASADSILKPTNRLYDTLTKILASVDVYQITYMSDGLKIKGFMDIPKKPGKYPCIIYNRGGQREYSKLTSQHYMGRMAQMASWGYCVVGSQYRGNDGGEGKEEFAGKDLDDVLNLIPLMNGIDRADTSRIGMWGISRGGLMIYLALTKTTRIRAAVVLSGLTDLKMGLENQPEVDSIFNGWLPEYRENKEQFLKNRSALEIADKICKATPIFIIQGTADSHVTCPQVFALAEMFYKMKQPFRLSLFEGGRHGLGEYYDETTSETKQFFDLYLRDSKKWPSLDLHWP